MKFLPLDKPELLELVARWLADKQNYQWLDFGNGRQIVTPGLLKIMTQRDTHFLRVFTSDGDDIPIGVVGLNNVDRFFKTATLWVVAGDKASRGRGYATRAVSKMLTLAFQELGLLVVNTWVVEHNPSIRVAQRVNFRPIGRQRQCHYIDGHAYDRLLFDILASEHRETENDREPHTAGTSR